MSTVKALYGGFVGLNGVPVVVHEGEEWDSEHPLVKSRPELFTEPVRETSTEPKKPVTRGKAKSADE